MMLCRNPFVLAGSAYGCGQCMPCRYNRRRVWTHRIMLEAAQYEDNAFVTLTYAPEFEPEGGTLVPGDTQLWLKRLRKAVEPFKFRYFLVGEYGDVSERPHYHAALFGFKSCEFGRSRYSKLRAECCGRCELVRKTWGKGHVLLGTLEDGSAGYMAGYVTKKMTGKDDVRLKGRAPEFGRMSLRPGIGFSAVWDIADALMRYELDVSMDDVPGGLRHGSRVMPFGRYLRRKLRGAVGRSEGAPQSVVDKISAELLPLRLAARSSKKEPSLKAQIVKANAGRVASVEARARIFKKGVKL